MSFSYIPSPSLLLLPLFHNIWSSQYHLYNHHVQTIPISSVASIDWFQSELLSDPELLCMWVFSKRQRITLRLLYAIGRPSVVCLSVCLSSVCRLLSVTLVHPTQAVELFGNFFSPYDSPGTLLFWCQKLLVGDAPFPLKFAFKVTHPLSNIAISTNIGS